MGVSASLLDFEVIEGIGSVVFKPVLLADFVLFNSDSSILFEGYNEEIVETEKSLDFNRTERVDGMSN